MSNQLHDALDEVVGSEWHSLGSDTEIMVALIDQLRAERAELAALRGVVAEAVAAMREYSEDMPYPVKAGIQGLASHPNWQDYARRAYTTIRALVATQEAVDAD